MKPLTMTRRAFLQSLGAGILITATGSILSAQEEPAPRRGGRRGGGGENANIAARLHIGKDGTITVMTGKVEGGQGARGEITQAAAEELCVLPDHIQLIMGDTTLCPDDGGTFGSQTTPRTIPAVRQASAGARQILIVLAADKWKVPARELEARDGKIVHTASGRELSYTDLIGEDSAQVFATTRPSNVTVTAVKEWKTLGTPFKRPNAGDLVIGNHQYPSDIVLPGMWYGKILRAPSYGATLAKIDLAPAKAIENVAVVQDGDFVGVAAPTSFLARKALDLLSKTAVWKEQPQIPSTQLFDHLHAKAHAPPKNSFDNDLAAAHKALRQTYNISYAQHAPMEPRAAVAQWQGNQLTVWTGTQNPFGVRSELRNALGASAESVRVIVPDFGGGFGGKHTGEAALEAARLAKGANRPIWIRWTREEEFTWAYFRPAAVILAEAGLNADGKISSWYFLNINSGPAGLPTPYNIASNRAQFIQSDPPLRQGSYRALAATANHFARESFMDELANSAGADPLAFRLAHLQDPRLIAVLKSAADKFDWANRWKKKETAVGVGLACGTEKGSYVAACVEVSIDSKQTTIAVRQVCQTFECGKILNPINLMSQVQGAIVMGIGPALREEIKFEGGRITNGTFTDYLVPRFTDLPDLQVQLLDRPDLTPAGAGETPIIAIAPAIANAVFHATGNRVRQMPIRIAAT